MMIIDYDKKFDILYIHLPTKRDLSYGEEVDGGIIYKDMDTDEIVGYAVSNFKKRLEFGEMIYV